MRKKELGWNNRSFIERITGEWSVSPAAAGAIYQKYCMGEMSEHLRGYCKKLFAPEIASLFSLIRRAGTKGNIFLSLSIDLPMELPVKCGAARIVKPSLQELLERIGLAISPSEWPLPPNEFFGRLAPFLEFYHDKGDHAVNHWLKRRLHWLGAVVK